MEQLSLPLSRSRRSRSVHSSFAACDILLPIPFRVLRAFPWSVSSSMTMHSMTVVLFVVCLILIGSPVSCGFLPHMETGLGPACASARPLVRWSHPPWLACSGSAWLRPWGGTPRVQC
eukprot:6023995-Pleurochrysis_carterae.AAC.1